MKHGYSAEKQASKPASQVSPVSFASKLHKSCGKHNTALMIGLDPNIDLIHPLLKQAFERKPEAFFYEQTPAHPLNPLLEALLQGSLKEVLRRDEHAKNALLLAAFSRFIIDASYDRLPCLKVQVAFFEREGAYGIAAMQDALSYAHARGMLCILDAKRGDVPHTAAQYAKAYLAAESPYNVDALTLNVYMGMDCLDPFLDEAKKNSKGLFLCVKTSNPGSADFQNLNCTASVSGSALPVYLRMAEKLEQVRKKNNESVFLGIVAAATKPQEAKELRERFPDMPFLVPGIGAQGASLADLSAYTYSSHATGMAGKQTASSGFKGALFSVSRALLYPHIYDNNSNNNININSATLSKMKTEQIKETAMVIMAEQKQAIHAKIEEYKRYLNS